MVSVLWIGLVLSFKSVVTALSQALNSLLFNSWNLGPLNIEDLPQCLQNFRIHRPLDFPGLNCTHSPINLGSWIDPVWLSSQEHRRRYFKRLTLIPVDFHCIDQGCPNSVLEGRCPPSLAPTCLKTPPWSLLVCLVWDWLAASGVFN